MSRCGQMALPKQCQDLCGSNVGHPKQEFMQPREVFGLSQYRDSAWHIFLSEPEAGDKHCIRHEGVDAFYLPSQVEAMLPVLLGRIQVVPLVVNPSQAKMRFGGNRPRRVTR
jgi:hypothetical protein